MYTQARLLGHSQECGLQCSAVQPSAVQCSAVQGTMLQIRLDKDTVKDSLRALQIFKEIPEVL